MCTRIWNTPQSWKTPHSDGCQLFIISTECFTALIIQQACSSLTAASFTRYSTTKFSRFLSGISAALLRWPPVPATWWNKTCGPYHKFHSVIEKWFDFLRNHILLDLRFTGWNFWDSTQATGLSFFSLLYNIFLFLAFSFPRLDIVQEKE